jgi:predicted RNase H-like HicB family nuclease
MLKTEKVSQYELPIKIEPQEEGGYLATCPVWSDCYAQGETIDEAIVEITAVAKSLIEIYKEEALKIPLISTPQQNLEKIIMPIIIAA